MKKFYSGDIAKSPRIQKLYDHLFEKMPEVEADRAVILTRVYILKSKHSPSQTQSCDNCK